MGGCCSPCCKEEDQQILIQNQETQSQGSYGSQDRISTDDTRHANDIKELNQQLQDEKQKREQGDRERAELKRQNEELRSSLSSMMNKKMAEDESDLENINVRVRPMTVMEDYARFCSQEWLEAKSTLDELAKTRNPPIPERDLLILLCDAMMKCYEHSEKLLSAVKKGVNDFLENPLRVEGLKLPLEPGAFERSGGIALREIMVDTSGIAIDDDLQLVIAKVLKQSSGGLNFEAPAKKVARAFFDDSCFEIDLEHADSKNIIAYFSSCLHTTWNMSIQQPAMRFVCDPPIDGTYDEKSHEPHYGSSDPKNPESLISAYVHPAMFHGVNQMRKARVLLSLKEPIGSTADMPPETASGTTTQERIYPEIHSDQQVEDGGN